MKAAPVRDARDALDASANGAKRLRLFVSYSRKDAVAADRLVLALEAAGYEVTIDRRDLPYGQEWQKELADFIRASDTVVWLVSPQSVVSQWCNWELGELARLSKRLMPVRLLVTDPATLPASLGKIHILPADGEFDIDVNLAALIAALDTDRAWIKQGTVLADRAHQWKGSSPTDGPPPPLDHSALLSGAQLRSAEAWRLRQPAKAPQPSADVLDLILTSRTAATARQRWLVAVVLVVALVVALILGMFVWQRRLAVERQDTTLVNQSRQLASLAEQSRAGGDAVRATLLGLAALPDGREAVVRPYVAEVERVLYASLLDQRETQLFAEMGQGTVSVLPGAAADRVPAIGANNLLRIYDLKAGSLVSERQGTQALVTKAYWRMDGQRLVAVSSDIDSSSAFLWDLRSARQIGELAGHAAAISAVAFSDDGRWLATVTEDGQARVFDADSGALAGQFSGTPGVGLYSVAFGPNGRDIAVGNRHGDIQLWQWDSASPVARARLMRTLPDRHDAQVMSLYFIESGRRLVSVAWDRSVLIQDLAGPRRAVRMEGHTDIALDVALSPDGRQLLTGSQDKMARLWDLAAGQARLPVLGGHASSVQSVGFSPDGRQALTASQNGDVRLWSGTPRDGIQSAAVLAGHAHLGGAAFTADGATVLSFGGQTLRAWQTQPQPERGVIGAHGGWVAGVAYSPDGQRLLSYARDGTASLWSSAGGPALGQLVGQLVGHLVGHRSAVVAAGFSADNTRVVTVSLDGSARLWRAQDGSPHAGTLTGLDNFAGLNLLAPGVRRLLTSNGEAKAMLWDIDQGQALTTLALPTGPGPASPNPTGAGPQRRTAVAWAEFSADGRQLVTVSGNATPTGQPGGLVLSNDGHVRLWNADTGALETTFGQDGWVIERTAFSPDGRHLALALRGGEVRVLALPQGAPVASFTADLGRSDTRWRGLAFSANGLRIVTSSRTTAQVWDARSGQAVMRAGVPAGETVGRTVFTPDAQRLVSFEGKTARLWDLLTGSEVAVLAGHSLSITGLAIAPDGHRLVTGSVDGRVRAWPLFTSTESLIHHAQQAVPRCLGPDELQDLYLPESPACWCRRMGKWWPKAAGQARGVGNAAAASAAAGHCSR